MSVTTLNSAPVANAGADVSVIAGRSVTLAGDASSDVDGDLLTYSWALIQRPNGSSAVLNGALNVSPSFRADRPGVYIAQLIVNDGSVDSAPDTVTITTGNTAPVADAGVDQPARFAGGVATVDGTASSDADGHTLTYRWSLLSVPSGSTARSAIRRRRRRGSRSIAPVSTWRSSSSTTASRTARPTPWW